jgi:hypothetical protein
VTAGSRPEAPLPVRPRPRHGETADSYPRRLAAANHLRFSYPRLYVAVRKGSYDRVDPVRLAALAGRDPDAIPRAFPGLAPAAPARRRPRQEAGENRQAGREARLEARWEAKREKYAAIRRDAEAGFSQRAIKGRHRTSYPTIALALASEEPPERKRIHREPTALNGLHTHIDAMIEDNPAIGTAAIWQRLADGHGTTVAYYTLRTYVASRQAAKPPDKVD